MDRSKGCGDKLCGETTTGLWILQKALQLTEQSTSHISGEADGGHVRVAAVDRVGLGPTTLTSSAGMPQC